MIDVMRRDGTWETNFRVEMRACGVEKLNVFLVQNSPFVSSYICWQVRGRESERRPAPDWQIGRLGAQANLDAVHNGGWCMMRANWVCKGRAVSDFFVVRIGSI